VKFLCYEGTMQTACLRLMGKKLLVALTMEGKFAGEGLQNIDEDDDMLSAMARELVERNGIGETADAVWKSLNAEHQKLFPTTSRSNGDVSLLEAPTVLPGVQPDPCSPCRRGHRRRFGLDLWATTGVAVGQKVTNEADYPGAGNVIWMM
jgi:hypothetical protein